jgi:hypothetical protein
MIGRISPGGGSQDLIRLSILRCVELEGLRA